MCTRLAPKRRIIAIRHRNVARERHRVPRLVKLHPRARVVPRRVARERHIPRLAVVHEATRRVGERDAVGDDVRSGALVAGVAAAELEAVAIALEALEVPAVEAVAPGVSVLDGDGGFELPGGG